MSPGQAAKHAQFEHELYSIPIGSIRYHVTTRPSDAGYVHAVAPPGGYIESSSRHYTSVTNSVYDNDIDTVSTADTYL
jgi:hypothetical protein